VSLEIVNELGGWVRECVKFVVRAMATKDIQSAMEKLRSAIIHAPLIVQPDGMICTLPPTGKILFTGADMKRGDMDSDVQIKQEPGLPTPSNCEKQLHSLLRLVRGATRTSADMWNEKGAAAWHMANPKPSALDSDDGLLETAFIDFVSDEAARGVTAALSIVNGIRGQLRLPDSELKTTISLGHILRSTWCWNDFAGLIAACLQSDQLNNTVTNINKHRLTSGIAITRAANLNTSVKEQHALAIASSKIVGRQLVKRGSS
jgi:hypothetical protein